MRGVVYHRHGEHRAAHIIRIEQIEDFKNGPHPFIFVAMHAGRNRKHRPIASSAYNKYRQGHIVCDGD